MPWTTNQQRAIDERNTNLLVSAAAGSGKTAVLVERIIKLILEDGVDIDRFLVVTFTKAAASEMKEKLIRAIRSQIRDEKDAAKRVSLKRQLDRMYLANISTFHSFAIGVIRRFFQYVDLDPSVRVLDEGEADILLWDALDDVFLQLFEEDDPEFLRFLDRHSRNGGETALKKDLLADYRKLRSIPHYFRWLDESLEKLEKPLPEAFAGEAADWMRQDYITHLTKAADAIAETAELFGRNGVPTYEIRMQEHREDVLALIECCRSADSFRDCMESFSPISMAQKGLPKGEVDAFKAAKADAGKLYKEAKDQIAELKKTYLVHTDEEEEQMMKQAAEDGAVYRMILQRLEDAYREEKQDRCVIDYEDIEHYAIEILQHEDAAAIYREQFHYIFIDEYQDSNYLQETIIGSIARDNNLFMVGDVKQSIYRFRMAEPDIFLEKYRRYAVSEGPDEKIDLNHNFRSKRPVIDCVNHIFSGLMDGYDEAAALRQGAPSPKDIDHPSEMAVIDRTAGLQEEEQDEIDEEIREMRWQEKEALAVCQLIRESLGKPFYDTKNDVVRGFELKDMVILMRSIKQAGPIYKDVFRREGIDVFVEDTSSFFETIEIQTFLDLLRLLDNPQRDIALLGVLRSFFFDFSIDDLIRIRLPYKSEPIYRAFAAYGSEGEDPALRSRCAEASAAIDRWRHLATYLPLDELIGRLMHDSGYYACMGAVPGGEQRQANLKTLADKARALMEMGRSRIQDLLRYVESLQQRGNVNVGQTSLLGENDNVVRIMTIHKSKGLEFPLVFVSGLGAGKGRGSHSGFAAIDRGMGIALPYSDEEKRYKDKLLLQTLISSKQKEQEREEDIRVLYVALTRARDKLIMTAAVDPEKESSSYYYHMMAPRLAEGSPVEIRQIDPFAGRAQAQEKPQRAGVDTLLKRYLQNRSDDIRGQVADRLGSRYGFEEDLTAKSKYSVTELNQHKEEHTPVIRIPSFFSAEQNGEEETTLSGAALGTVLHTAMEHLPIRDLAESGSADPSAVIRYLDYLVEREILTDQDRRSIDPAMLTSFAASPLGRRIAKCEEVHRETPFTYTFSMDGRDVLVQGIIDLWFVEEDRIILVDYKSNMKTDHVRELYQQQLDLYKEALEGLTGRKVTESYLYLLREQRLVNMM